MNFSNNSIAELPETRVSKELILATKGTSPFEEFRFTNSGLVACGNIRPQPIRAGQKAAARWPTNRDMQGADAVRLNVAN